MHLSLHTATSLLNKRLLCLDRAKDRSQKQIQEHEGFHLHLHNQQCCGNIPHCRLQQSMYLMCMSNGTLQLMLVI